MRKRREMTCEEFTATMAQLIASGEDIFAHPHVKRCKTHRALLEDLEAIATAARQLFPDVDPSESLWQRIEDEVAPESAFGESVSDPFPGYRLVLRVRVAKGLDSASTPAVYDQVTGRGNAPPPGTPGRAGGPVPPPKHGEERR